jgi:hypothetical protein
MGDEPRDLPGSFVAIRSIAGNIKEPEMRGVGTLLSIGIFSLAQTACSVESESPDRDEVEFGPDAGQESEPPVPPGPGTLAQLGDPCAADGDCAGGLCITRPAMPSYCSATCSPGQEDGGYLQCSAAYSGPGHPQCTVPIDTSGDGVADRFGCEALCADGGQTWPCGPGQSCRMLSVNGYSYGACLPGSSGGGGDGGGSGGGDDGADANAGGGGVTCSRTVNGLVHQVHCQASGNGAVTCECRINGDLVQTCSQSSLTCALPNGTCCSGF